VIRPIRDIAGEEMFCEVFFDDARVPAAYRLGDEGQGWLVAMGTLGHERVGTAGLAIGMRSDLDAMVSLTRSVNPQALEDPDLRARIARAHIDIEYTKLLNYRALSKILRNEKSWPEVPLAKLQWSHLAQTLAELAVDLLGPVGMMARGGRLEPPLSLPALHLDRGRDHRGPEEHHRRPGDPSPEAVGLARGSAEADISWTSPGCRP
jgi:alkylation response protein AidB-like acyl-CoA dehydrogenase